MSMACKALPCLAILVGLYVLLYSISEMTRVLRAGGSLLCTLTGGALPLVCPMTDAMATFQSGASLQISQRKLKELATQIDLDAEFASIRTLPNQLHVQANWVNDNINLLLTDGTVASSSSSSRALVSECKAWSKSLHTTARQVRALQLTIRSFAERVVHVLPIVLNIWKSGEGTIAGLRHGFTELRKESERLIGVLRQTDEALANEREHASQFVARIMDNVALTQDEILLRAETWSWTTTVIVYGAAASAGVVTGGTLSAPAALLTTSIAHLAHKTADTRKVKALEAQRVQQESTAYVLKNARSLIGLVSDELQTIQHEMEQSEDGLDEIAVVMAAEDGRVRLPTAYTAKALPNGGAQSEVAQQIVLSIEDVIKTYGRLLETTERAIHPIDTPTTTPWEAPPALALPSLHNTQKQPTQDNEADTRPKQTESLFDSIAQKWRGMRK